MSLWAGSAQRAPAGPAELPLFLLFPLLGVFFGTARAQQKLSGSHRTCEGPAEPPRKLFALFFCEFLLHNKDPTGAARLQVNSFPCVFVLRGGLFGTVRDQQNLRRSHGTTTGPQKTSPPYLCGFILHKRDPAGLEGAGRLFRVPFSAFDRGESLTGPVRPTGSTRAQGNLSMVFLDEIAFLFLCVVRIPQELRGAKETSYFCVCFVLVFFFA